MKKKERVIEFWHIVVVILAILLFLLLKTSMTGKAWYRDYGSSFGGFGGFDFFGLSFFSFTDLYASYGYIIDAVIFLMIFLGLAQSVFKERFKESRGLYVGMGLFLAFALLMWEERMGISILSLFGPAVFAIFVLLLILVVYKWVRHETGMNPLIVASILYVLLYFFVLKTEAFYTMGNRLFGLVNLRLEEDYLDGLFYIAAVIAGGSFALAVINKVRK